MPGRGLLPARPSLCLAGWSNLIFPISPVETLVMVAAARSRRAGAAHPWELLDMVTAVESWQSVHLRSDYPAWSAPPLAVAESAPRCLSSTNFHIVQTPLKSSSMSLGSWPQLSPWSTSLARTTATTPETGATSPSSVSGALSALCDVLRHRGDVVHTGPVGAEKTCETPVKDNFFKSLTR